MTNLTNAKNNAVID